MIDHVPTCQFLSPSFVSLSLFLFKLIEDLIKVLIFFVYGPKITFRRRDPKLLWYPCNLSNLLFSNFFFHVSRRLVIATNIHNGWLRLDTSTILVEPDLYFFLKKRRGLSISLSYFLSPLSTFNLSCFSLIYLLWPSFSSLSLILFLSNSFSRWFLPLHGFSLELN